MKKNILTLLLRTISVFGLTFIIFYLVELIASFLGFRTWPMGLTTLDCYDAWFEVLFSTLKFAGVISVSAMLYKITNKFTSPKNSLSYKVCNIIWFIAASIPIFIIFLSFFVAFSGAIFCNGINLTKM